MPVLTHVSSVFISNFSFGANSGSPDCLLYLRQESLFSSMCEGEGSRRSSDWFASFTAAEFHSPLSQGGNEGLRTRQLWLPSGRPAPHTRETEPISQAPHLPGGLAVFGGWVSALLSLPQEASLSSGRGGANHLPLALHA